MAAATAESRLALILLNLVVLGRSTDQNPMACAEDISNMISNIATASMDITFATEDCAPPGLDELDCSADIIDTVQQMASLASVISSSTGNCGGIDNSCAVGIADTITDTLDFSQYLISAAADCAMAPFNCVVDVFEAINAIMSVAVDIDGSITACNPNAMDPFADPEATDEYLTEAALNDMGMGQAPMVERRLAESGRAKRAPLEKVRGERRSWQYHVEHARQTLAAARERHGIGSARWKTGQTHFGKNATDGAAPLTVAGAALVLV